jgi:hypothetical protein
MTTTPSDSNDMAAPHQAPGCSCEHPWRDEGSCVRCGRWVAYSEPRAPRPHRSGMAGNPWTPAGVVRALRAHEFFTGRPPTPTEWSLEDDRQWPSARTVMQLFGSFDAALEAARAIPSRSSS